MTWRFFSLFLIFFAAPSAPLVASATAPSCSSWGLPTLTRAQQQACQIECETYYVENPDARPANPRGVCEYATDKLFRNLNPNENLINIGACMKGAWDGVLTLPETAKAYLTAIDHYASNAKQEIQKKNEFLRQCQTDLPCRRQIARGMIAFSQKDRSGRFILTDEQVDQKIQGRHVTELMHVAEQNRSQLVQVCSAQLSTITKELSREDGAWNDARLLRRYEAIAQWDPGCPAALRIEKPRPKLSSEQTQSTSSSWIESLGIKTQCYPAEKLAELSCYELAKFITDPLNLAVGGGALALKAIKTAGIALKSAKNAKQASVVTPVKRIGENIERRTPDTARDFKPLSAPRTWNREQYIKAHLSRDFATEAENRAWMKEATRTKPDGKSLFLDIENSKMKFLNDTLKDKNLVTALTNRHKEFLFEKLELLKKEFPDLEILKYSDFKSSRFAIKGKITPELRKRLDDIFQKTNSEFVDELAHNNLLRKEFTEKWSSASSVQKTDLAAEWFRAGIGETADQATLAARYSRNASGGNKLHSFESAELQENMQTNLKAVEMYRSDIQKELSSTGLLESFDNSNRMIPRKDVIDLARKNKDADAFRLAVNQKYGTSLSQAESRRLQDYLELVDDFSPGIHIAKREVATLNDAAHGGLSADFAGMGSHNLYETAAGLAKAKDLATALEQTRMGEHKVTEFFQKRMRNRQAIIRNYLEDKKGMAGLKINCSGDDCVVITPSSLNSKQRDELVKRLSKTDDPSSMRMSFVNSSIKSADDLNLMATHGEAIEKKLRAELIGKLPNETLNKVTFAIEMNGSTVGQGGVRLITGNSRIQLAPLELESIQSSFQKAVEKINQDLLKNTGRDSKYMATPMK